MQKIMICAKGFPPTLGGVETYSEQVAFAYARRGYQTTVLTQFDGDEKVKRIRGGVSFDVLNVRPGPQVAIFARMLKQLRHLKDEFDFAHATTWRVAIPLAMLEIPYYVTVHAREVMECPLVLRPLMNYVLGKAKRIVCISEFSQWACAKFSKPIERNSVVAYNGISSHDRDGEREPNEVFVACRLIPQKNVASVIEAVKILNHRGTRVQLVIAGDGPELPKLKSLAADVPGQVSFLGHVPSFAMSSLYRRASLFVHPHLKPESFGLAIADAMGLGVPVICTPYGAPNNYIINGLTGWIVRGTAEQIADAIERALKSPALRRSIADAAYTFAVENFSWDRHISAVLT